MGKPSSTLVVILMMVAREIMMIGATNVWGGVNSYFLYALNTTDRTAHLRAMQANGLKVARIFIVGVDAGAKGSSSRSVEELEPDMVGIYNDDVLKQIDSLMLEATQYGVKLLIALHDRYSLGCLRRDAYVTKYNITDDSPNCNTTLNNPTIFYTDAKAQDDFDSRIKHILTHRNPHFRNRTWGEINEAIFGFEPENEAQGHVINPDWKWSCRRAVTVRQYIFNGILIVTGLVVRDLVFKPVTPLTPLRVVIWIIFGPLAFGYDIKKNTSLSLDGLWQLFKGGGVDISTSTHQFKCKSIDVVSIHDFNSNPQSFSSSLDIAKSKAVVHGKRILLEKFGSIGNDTHKSSYLSSAIDAIARSGIPWLAWEFVSPGYDKGDYEFGIGSEAWNKVACRGKIAFMYLGAFSWPEISSTLTNTTTCENPTIIKGLGLQAPKKSLPYWSYFVVVGCGTTIMIVALGLVIKRKQSKRRSMLLEMSNNSILLGMPKRFSHKAIVRGTRSYSNPVGEGGYGIVYKCILPRLGEVAVKVLDSLKSTSQKQFLTEVAVIGTLHHFNLVRFLGFCLHQNKRMLIYEYLPNGSLDKHLFANPASTLTWSLRHSISLGIARGLQYLHHHCRHQIVHCDIKPHNILLDHNFTPKIADFGLSRLMLRDERDVFTHSRGTPGYLAPELDPSSSVHLSPKCDVYSFGIMLLEIIAGRRWLELQAASSQLLLAEYCLKQAQSGEFDVIVDERINDNIDMEQVRLLVSIAILCIQNDPLLRPEMRQVVLYIERKIELPEVTSQNLNEFETPLQIIE